MSTKSKSKRRNVKKKSSASADEFVPKKRFEGEGFDFTAMLLGMVISMMMLFLLWSYIGSRGAVARSFNPENAQMASEAISSMDSESFSRLIETRDIDKLSLVLEGLEGQVNDGDADQQFRTHCRRVDAANKMLRLPLSDSQKRLAITSKIQGSALAYELNMVHKLNQPNLGQDLKQTASEYKKHSDPIIAKSACLELFRLDAMELTKTKDYLPSTKALVGQLSVLMKMHPDDDQLFALVRRIANYYLLSYDKKLGVQFISEIQELGRETDSNKTSQFLEDIAEGVILAETRFQQLFENRLVQGAMGQEQLFKTSLKLVANRKIGQSVLSKVEKAAHWFEANGQIERANSIYEAIRKSCRFYDTPELRSHAQTIAIDGVYRVNSIGKTFRFEGFELNENPIDPKQFEGKVALICFWSNQDEESISILKELHNQTSDWTSDEIEVVAYCIDETITPQTLARSMQMERFQFVARDPFTKKSPMLEQSPSPRVPRIVLVNSEGKITRTGGADLDVKTHAELLLDSK
jgi:Na+-transporting methylmalonyl-CoA/oxaloacetate decarboxylase gamma subunit